MEIGRFVGRRLHTFLTRAEVIRPFLNIFSMSSTLVKPLDLQAIVGGKASWRS